MQQKNAKNKKKKENLQRALTLSSNLLNKQVAEMKAEYFPPKVEIILQNEFPTDFYIIVSGAVVCGPLQFRICCICILWGKKLINK